MSRFNVMPRAAEYAGTITGPQGPGGYPTCCICHSDREEPTKLWLGGNSLELLAHDSCMKETIDAYQHRVEITWRPAT